MVLKSERLARLQGRRDAKAKNAAGREKSQELNNLFRDYGREYGNNDPAAWPQDDPITKLAMKQKEAGQLDKDLPVFQHSDEDEVTASQTAAKNFRTSELSRRSGAAANKYGFAPKQEAPAQTDRQIPSLRAAATPRADAAPAWFASFNKGIDSRFGRYDKQLSDLSTSLG